MLILAAIEPRKCYLALFDKLSLHCKNERKLFSRRRPAVNLSRKTLAGADSSGWGWTGCLPSGRHVNRALVSDCCHCRFDALLGEGLVGSLSGGAKSRPTSGAGDEIACDISLTKCKFWPPHLAFSRKIRYNYEEEQAAYSRFAFFGRSQFCR